MAGKGPAPKHESKVRRTNNKGQTVTLTPDGELRGIPLPRAGVNIGVGMDGRPVTAPWPEQTKSWWTNWRHSAQAQMFSASDWDFLLETAVLHARFWLGDASLAAELRQRVAKFGATPEDRLRLKMDIETEASAAQSDSVASLTDYRTNLRAAGHG